MEPRTAAPRVGTLTWCESTDGRLSGAEKIAFARNVAALRAESIFDEFRHRLGLLRPAAIELATLAPPDSQLVRDAEEFARGIYNDILWAHCMRTYYFGALVAAFDGIEFDREVFYAAAICHDVGVNESAAGPVSRCCFAHSGGRLTCDHLTLKGHDQKALRIGNAISTHINLFVPPNEYPAESTLTAIGATCDLLGPYVRRIERSTLAAVVERWPRHGLVETFGELVLKKHLDDSRTAVLVEMGGAVDGNSVHPIEAVLAAS